LWGTGYLIIKEIELAIKRWLYRGGHPNRLARIINKGWAYFHALGIFPDYLVTLEVTGRQSGKKIDFPLAMTVMNGERYLVSMLGENTNWVRNVRANNGMARLRHGISEEVMLVEVDVQKRAPILKAFLRHAPGARPHIPVDKDAQVAEFEKIASRYPVFRVERRD
jgi:F420H(2)-dependent quinone reductase